MNLPSYPGAVVTRQKQEAKKAELEFRTSASIDSIFSFYGDHLSRQGWLRSRFTIKHKGNEYEAEYVRAGQSVKLKVEWKKGHDKVELKT